jgi:ketosteroid isomerase-like protein
MSQENVEIVRAAIEAVNRDDWDAVFKDAAPSFRWDSSRSLNADTRGVFSANEARQILKQALAVWESAWIEINEVIDMGDHVVVPHTTHVRGRDGIETEARTTWLITIRKGKIERGCLYQDTREALEAVGLSQNVEVVRRAHEAFNRSGLDAFLEHLHPDAEYDITAAIGPYAGTYYGRSAIRNFLRDYFDSWEYVQLESEDFLDVGEDHVVFLLHMHMRGKGSGIEIDARPTNVWTVRAGEAVRIAVYNGRDEALEALAHRERAKLE